MASRVFGLVRPRSAAGPYAYIWQRLVRRTARCFFAMLLGSATALPTAAAQEAPSNEFSAASSSSIKATRTQTTIRLQILQAAKKLRVPRLASPIRSLAWSDGFNDTLTLKPEPDVWEISFGRQQALGKTLVLKLGASPQLIDEMQPITSQADGSYWLPAHLAETAGDKIRYEPQPFKNTVGYWTGISDSAKWTFKLEKPGSFNIGLLQGCGEGQGGSLAKMIVVAEDRKTSTQELSFEVEETGHFQDFRWRHLDRIELERPGLYTLRIVPERIAKNALMDVRAVHLIRLPD